MGEWKKVRIGEFLTESKEEAINSDSSRRITVRLNCRGVEHRKLKAEKDGATKYYIRHAGQFIYGKQNIHKGAFGIIPKELEGFTSSADLPAFDFINDLCFPEFLNLWLQVDERYKALQKNVKGAGSQRLAVSAFLDEGISLPDLPTQKQIVKRISENLKWVNELAKEIETQKGYTKLLRRNILQDAIEGKLTADWRKEHPVQKGNPDYNAEALFESIQKERKVDKKQKALPPILDAEKPFELPAGWKWVRLGEINDNIEAGKSILCKEVVPCEDDVGIVKTGVCSFGYFKEDESKTCLSKEDWRDKYAIHVGDFLIGRANTLELVGSCVIVDKLNKRLMLSDKILRINFPKEICKQLLLNFMRTRFFRNQIEKAATGSSPTMKNIAQDSINHCILPLPPLAEQQQIIASVSAMLNKVSEIERQIQERKILSEKLSFGIIKKNLEG